VFLCGPFAVYTKGDRSKLALQTYKRGVLRTPCQNGCYRTLDAVLWLVKYVGESNSRVLLFGDSAQHRSVERGDALRILEQSGAVRYVELLQTPVCRVKVGLATAATTATGGIPADLPVSP
jgi:hypothetical protein